MGLNALNITGHLTIFLVIQFFAVVSHVLYEIHSGSL